MKGILIFTFLHENTSVFVTIFTCQWNLYASHFGSVSHASAYVAICICYWCVEGRLAGRVVCGLPPLFLVNSEFLRTLRHCLSFAPPHIWCTLSLHPGRCTSHSFPSITSCNISSHKQQPSLQYLCTIVNHRNVSTVEPRRSHEPPHLAYHGG